MDLTLVFVMTMAQQHQLLEDEEGEDAVNCPVRWPAETHFSDHVCAISNVWHEGPHRCMRCGEKFNCT